MPLRLLVSTAAEQKGACVEGDGIQGLPTKVGRLAPVFLGTLPGVHFMVDHWHCKVILYPPPFSDAGMLTSSEQRAAHTTPYFIVSLTKMLVYLRHLREKGEILH